MRRALSFVAVLLTALFVLVPASAASTAPRSASGGGPSGGLADRDHNRISDELQPDLDASQTEDPFEVIVTFAGAGSAASARREVGDFTLKREFRIIRGFAGTMSASQIRGLARNPNVHRIERDIRIAATLDAANRDFGTEHARTEFGVTGAGVGVCVVDTGADLGHESLDSKGLVPFYDAIAGQTEAYDDNGHGTHVSSIAVGDGTGGSNAATFRGVAPDASLSVAKVLDASGYGDDSGVVAGMEWCAEQSGVRVISMSLGSGQASDGSDALSLAANSAVTVHGKVVVVAAGNSGDQPQTVGSPGAATQAITVGAVAEWSAPEFAENRSEGVYLAPWSSRGPTLDNRTKPDVSAPGVTIAAAAAGTTAGYVSLSGTSMATPFVSGTVALALAANPSLTSPAVRTLVEGTAQDRGAAGKDNEWGAGLLDGYAVVAEAEDFSYSPTAFPAATRVNGSVAAHGLWSYSFTVSSDALTIPIAAMITIDGSAQCVYSCLGVEWAPDLDARLKDPTGIIVAESTCALGDECGIGRQETLHVMPTVAGTYTVEVYPYEGRPNRGKGGSFALDLSRGPLGAGSPPPPPPPPPPTIVVHVGDLDGSSTSGRGNWTANVTVTVHDAAENPVEGVTVTGTWTGGTTSSCVTGVAGTCTLTRNVSKKSTSVVFGVSNLTKAGATYAASSNHDPESDSNGTTIVVNRP